MQMLGSAVMPPCVTCSDPHVLCKDFWHFYILCLFLVGDMPRPKTGLGNEGFISFTPSPAYPPGRRRLQFGFPLFVGLWEKCVPSPK